MFTRITGPACPHCGCEDSRILEEQEQEGRRVEIGEPVVLLRRTYTYRQCRLCWRSFEHTTEWEESRQRQEADTGVPYVALRCPVCNSKAVKTTRTMPAAGRARVRYHRCSGCSATFKSTEAL
ncbi:MAG: hypothetical protein ACOY3P_15300 [Planctomycetota bacterium]